MTTLQERLSEAMEAAGFKQADLVRATKLTRSAISHWLNGSVTELKGKNLTRAAIALNVNEHWLATGEGLRDPYAVNEMRASYSSGDLSMLDKFHMLDPEDQQRVAVIIDAFIKKPGR